MPLTINFWYQILKNQMVFKVFSPKMILTRCSDMIAKKNSLFTTTSNSLWSAVNVPLIFSLKCIVTDDRTHLWSAAPKVFKFSTMTENRSPLPSLRHRAGVPATLAPTRSRSRSRAAPPQAAGAAQPLAPGSRQRAQAPGRLARLHADEDNNEDNNDDK